MSNVNFLRKDSGIKAPGHTLVLNADCSPMSLVPIDTKCWKDSVEAMWSGKATVLHVYDDWIVRSPTIELKVPAVIMFNQYAKPKNIVPFNRDNVFIRDGFVCQYCLKVFPHNELTFDHVHPASMGGPTNWTNIATACRPCNHHRGSNTRIKPVRLPYRPTYWEMADKYKRYPVRVPHESWSYYLGWEPELIKVAA